MRKQRAKSRFRAAAAIARLCTGFQGNAGEEDAEEGEGDGEAGEEDGEGKEPRTPPPPTPPLC